MSTHFVDCLPAVLTAVCVLFRTWNFCWTFRW